MGKLKILFLIALVGCSSVIDTNKENSIENAFEITATHFMERKDIIVLDILEDLTEYDTVDIISGYDENIFVTISHYDENNSSSFVTSKVYKITLKENISESYLELIYESNQPERVFNITEFDKKVYLSVIANYEETQLSKHSVIELDGSSQKVLKEVFLDWCYMSPQFYTLNNTLYLASVNIDTSEETYQQTFELSQLKENQFESIAEKTCEGQNYSSCSQFEFEISSYSDRILIAENPVDDDFSILWEVDAFGNVTETIMNRYVFSATYLPDEETYVLSTTTGLLKTNNLNNQEDAIILTKENVMLFPMVVNKNKVYGVYNNKHNQVSLIDIENNSLYSQNLDPTIKDSVWPDFNFVNNKIYISLHNNSQIEIMEYEYIK